MEEYNKNVHFHLFFLIPLNGKDHERIRFHCVKSKNAQEQKWFKISTSMCMPSLRTTYET